jgi:hypothetical protein
VIHDEFKQFLFDYFTSTKYDNVELQQRVREENDPYLKALHVNSINQKGVKQQLQQQQQTVKKVKQTTTTNP